MAQEVEQDVVDPVCGMTISPLDSVGTVEHLGHTYYFCNDSCLERFKANPDEFVGHGADTERAAIHASADPDAEYTCPMHPEVRQRGLGSCPKCGMALEPEMVTAEEEANPELVDMTRRFWIATALSLPVLFLGMWERMPAIQLILATLVVLWAGWPFFERGWASIVNRSPNMFTLIAMGTGTAYAYSIVAVLFPDIFPHSFRHGGTAPLYFEAAAVI